MTPLWRTVQWSMGGNDRYNDCAFVSLANLLDLWGAMDGDPFTIGEAECELFYALEAQFNSQHPETDNGAVLEEVIRYWRDKGWPADPVNKPAGYRPIAPTDFAAAIHRQGGVPCWMQLPAGADDDALFGDDTLTLEPGDGHAVLAVEADAAGLWVISWARPWRLSWVWWTRFGRGQFEVVKAD